MPPKTEIVHFLISSRIGGIRFLTNFGLNSDFH